MLSVCIEEHAALAPAYTHPLIPHPVVTREIPLYQWAVERRVAPCDWKNLFKTPSFIVEHLHHSARQNPLLAVDNNISKRNHWHLCLSKREMQVLEFQSPHINDSLTAYGAAVYSSNGLLCVELFSESQRSLWLWNPAIRKVHRVPKSLNKYEGESFSVGFGFSSIVNDYKIVKLFMSDCLVARVEVYALMTGLWTKVEPGNLEGACVSHPSAFNCNGAIFWVGMKEGVDVGRKIVSFDIGMELVTLIPFCKKIGQYTLGGLDPNSLNFRVLM
ncbi:uncharacterized protein LOC114756820 [Neltuma alba]|uniref:uncharacterized protein LOC114756820 n=1 Tax=Neltuma alba TaxID=207710 RepID=UPI0010A53203|nr:uncharacterized protein LOC114756820 [Prosopis alba]